MTTYLEVICPVGAFVRYFPDPDLNEAGRAADAAREVNGAVVACWLR
jgi:hypothetical protein